MVDKFVLLVTGDTSTGTAGTAGTVAKLHVPEYGLIPAAFFALTRQKYVVLFNRDMREIDVPVAVESSNVVDIKEEFVDTCT